MAITFPLSHPLTPGFTGFEMKRIGNVGVAASVFTFKQEVQKHQGQIWAIVATLPQMNRVDAAEWEAFITKLNGPEGTFLIGDPDGQTPRGVATGTPLIKGASQLGNSLITDNWTPDITNILRANDYIQLSSGLTTHLHVNLNDVDSDGVGEAILDIWPDLRISPINNDPIIVTSAKGIFRLLSNEFANQINTIKHHSVEFPAIEAI